VGVSPFPSLHRCERDPEPDRELLLIPADYVAGLLDNRGVSRMARFLWSRDRMLARWSRCDRLHPP
jgi:hypothetical protein